MLIRTASSRVCCVRLNKCSLFSNKHNGTASVSIQKVFEQQTGTPRHQTTTEKSHTGHCALM